jgi:ABC-2 type transport system permease protein
MRHGVRYWLDGYRSMMRFELATQKLFLPMFMVLQVLIGGGMAVMYGFFLGDLPQVARTYVTTGIPALALIPLGFVALPNVVGQLRAEGSYDYMWSLPVPRLASAAATFTIYTLVGMPGLILSLLVAAWRYDVRLDVQPSIVVAILLTSLMSASVGYGLAHGISDPQITNLIGNVLIFFVTLFTPMVVPVARFPHWLGTIHEWLPFHHMAVVIRAGLAPGLDPNLWRSYVVLGAWTVGAWLVAGLAIGRRH